MAEEYPLIEPAHWENPEPAPSEKTLPLGTIIGKVVSQCAEAQQAAGASMWEYLRQVAFDPDSPREVAMLQFDFVDQNKRLKVRLPLISVLPAQYVQIRDVEIDFNVSINTQDAKKKVKKAEGKMRTLSKTSLTRLTRICPVRLAPPKKTVQADADASTSFENNIRVKIKAGNMDISGGMARLLELASNRGVRITPLEEAET